MSKITYNGKGTTLAQGKSATLPCKETVAKSDIVIAFTDIGKITYNGKTTIVEAGKTATLRCNGKKMRSDVEIAQMAGGTVITAKFAKKSSSVPDIKLGVWDADYKVQYWYTVTSTTPTEYTLIAPQDGGIALSVPDYAPSTLWSITQDGTSFTEGNLVDPLRLPSFRFTNGATYIVEAVKS